MTVPWKRQSMKTKVGNKTVIAKSQLDLKWLHWRKFHFECAIDVKGYSNEVYLPILPSLVACQTLGKNTHVLINSLKKMT